MSRHEFTSFILNERKKCAKVIVQRGIKTE